ncbi:MAG TPA: formylmethanofuran dehydrogenase subunit C [Methanothrix sp.]|nr:formylmethanofuran dehydrogenase subunit C [Methanothrix sp.]
MAEVLLKLKEKIGITVEAEVIRPDGFAGKSAAEIQALPVWQGPRKLALSELFDVELRDGASAQPGETAIFMEGDLSRVKRIGQGMKEGKIEISGSAGMHLGEEMSGGSILVKGDAGSWAGMEMKGGSIRIQGNAADHVGSAYRGSWRGMTGGEIRIEGNARSALGAGLVGGRIIVEGDVENFCGIRQSGGAIIIKGSAVRGLGAEMNGGIIAVCGSIRQFSPGFVYSTRETDPVIGEVRLEGSYSRFTGDYSLGKNVKGTLYSREG